MLRDQWYIYIGDTFRVAGQQRNIIAVPHHPFVAIPKTPYPGEKHFLKSGLPRSIKVKDLIPQKKVKEWVHSGASLLTSDEDLSEADAESTEHVLQQLDGIHTSAAILIRDDEVMKRLW